MSFSLTSFCFLGLPSAAAMKFSDSGLRAKALPSGNFCLLPSFALRVSSGLPPRARRFSARSARYWS